MAVTYDDIFDRYSETEIQQVCLDVKYDLYTSGMLTQYHWYKISGAGVGTDFTSVGSPDNVIGTRFQASTSLISPTWGSGGELQTGKTVVEFIDEYIDKARVELAGYAAQAESSVDETNAFQAEFLICQSMALLFENVGLTEKANRLLNDAKDALYSIWGTVVYADGETAETNLQPIRKVQIGITKCDYSEFDTAMGW